MASAGMIEGAYWDEDGWHIPRDAPWPGERGKPLGFAEDGREKRPEPVDPLDSEKKPWTPPKAFAKKGG